MSNDHHATHMYAFVKRGCFKNKMSACVISEERGYQLLFQSLKRTKYSFVIGEYRSGQAMCN